MQARFRFYIAPFPMLASLLTGCGDSKPSAGTDGGASPVDGAPTDVPLSDDWQGPSLDANPTPDRTFDNKGDNARSYV